MKLFLLRIVLALGLAMPIMVNAAEIEAPIALEVTGVVVSHSNKYKSSAIVDDRIWWEGETKRIRKEDDSWVTLTLTKVEMVKGKGGVLTFTVETDNKDTFTVSIKKSTTWGLHR